MHIDEVRVAIEPFIGKVSESQLVDLVLIDVSTKPDTVRYKAGKFYDLTGREVARIEVNQITGARWDAEQVSKDEQPTDPKTVTVGPKQTTDELPNIRNARFETEDSEDDDS